MSHMECCVYSSVVYIHDWVGIIGGVWRCKLTLWYFAWPTCLQLLLVVLLWSTFANVTPATLRIARHGACARTAPTRRPVFAQPYDSSFLSSFIGTEQRSKQKWRALEVHIKHPFWRPVWEGYMISIANMFAWMLGCLFASAGWWNAGC